MMINPPPPPKPPTPHWEELDLILPKIDPEESNNEDKDGDANESKEGSNEPIKDEEENGSPKIEPKEEKR